MLLNPLEFAAVWTVLWIVSFLLSWQAIDTFREYWLYFRRKRGTIAPANSK